MLLVLGAGYKKARVGQFHFATAFLFVFRASGRFASPVCQKHKAPRPGDSASTA
jgi:hypothetical protein